MTKTYHGEPGAEVRVTVQTGNRKAKKLKPRPGKEAFAWGVSTVEAANLALAILDDVLPKQPDRALKLMQRFKWRTVKDWNTASPWTITDEEAMEIVKDIEKVERDTATGRRMMSQEHGIVSAAGNVPGEIDWKDGKPPVLSPNHARKE